ncbi:integrase, catalytic region, zinc finger, CCHC-type containing protein, partial [Tanacetum coccineum]
TFPGVPSNIDNWNMALPQPFDFLIDDFDCEDLVLLSKIEENRLRTLLDPFQFSYPKRRLTMEELVNKFNEEGKREHEEMDAFIREFRTTNELLLKERNNSLSELEFEHMTGNLKLLRNVIEKFMGTVHFGNDNFAAITGYEDYVQGNLMICHIYYGEDLLTCSRDSNLYALSISEMPASSPGRAKKATFPPKLILGTTFKLELIHMDLCGPMRVKTVNRNKHILVIVDDYSQYTWVYFLRTKDETPEMIIKFITQIQRNMKVLILKVRFDNGTEFKNEKLRSYYEKLGIMHQTSVARTPQQNGVVERPGRNCSNFQESSEELNEIPSKEDFDNLFGPLYEVYYATRTPEVLDNSTANTLNNEDTPSSSSIIIEHHDAPQIVSSSKRPLANEPTTLVFVIILKNMFKKTLQNLMGTLS